jgi:hypothetical protein
MCAWVSLDGSEIYETEGLKMGKVDFGGVVAKPAWRISGSQVGDCHCARGLWHQPAQRDEARPPLDMLLEIMNVRKAGTEVRSGYRDAHLVLPWRRFAARPVPGC